MPAPTFQKYKGLFYGGSVLIALLLRATALPIISPDMQLAFLPWYNFIVAHGGIQALGQTFTNYTPPYLYLMAAITYTHNIIPPIIGIKLISIGFDLALAVALHEIVRLMYGWGYRSWLAFTTALFIPTVVINSSNWGQMDVIYTFFLLLCVYYVATGHPFQAMLFFSIALTFKLQAIFLLPFLLVLFIKREIPWRYIVLPPLVYFIMILPSALLGRPLPDLMNIYLQQADYSNELSMYAPNAYAFCVVNTVTCTATSSTWIAFVITGGVVLIYVVLWARSRSPLTIDRLLLMALMSVILMPFFLPRMHERYFYPADVLSVALIFYQPRAWILAVSVQIASLLAYSGYLFGAPVTAPMLGGLINIVSLLFLLLYLTKLRPVRRRVAVSVSPTG